MTSLYPSEKGTAVGEMYLEALKKYPPDENLATEIVPAAIKATHQGIKVIGISEVKQGKFEEAYTYSVNFAAMFHTIEGFEYTLDTYLTVEEGLAVIGMSVPE
jgi:hypothetical protein